MAAAGGLALGTSASAQGGRAVPPGAVDCHVHVIGPQDRYPMDPDRVYTTGVASVADLKAMRARTGLSRNVLVQPSFYGTDNGCMIDALAELGESARGVAVVAPDTPLAELKAMDARGVRGVRLNLETGGERDPAAAARQLERASALVAPLGWHVQIYAALEVVAALAPTVAKVPTPVVFDHFGLSTAAKGTGQPGFSTLVDMVKSRKVYVKLSAPHRISNEEPGYADVAPIAKALIAAGPDRMLYGSDWPHTAREPGKSRTDVHAFRVVDDAAVLALLSAWAPDPAVHRAILIDNPVRLYRF